MNIFCTSPSPYLSAQALDDKRVVKMVLESAQVLSTVLHGRGLPAPYRPTHASHPCTLWAAADDRNLYWLLQHAYALADEYHVRYGRRHACCDALDAMAPRIKRKRGAPESFVNAARHRGRDLDFTHMPTHDAYRAYLRERWKGDKREPRWTNRGAPEWL